jgi:hypothetical protein
VTLHYCLFVLFLCLCSLSFVECVFFTAMMSVEIVRKYKQLMKSSIKTYIRSFVGVNTDYSVLRIR